MNRLVHSVTADLTITPDMLRRPRLADVAPRWACDLFGLIAVVLFGVGLSLAGILLTSQSLGDWQ